MKYTKTFKIGEYAVGGIIVAEINNDKVTIISKQWDTSAGYTKKSSQKNAKELSRNTTIASSNNSRWGIDTYLNMLTTSYYSGVILEWIESKIKLN
jgi:hypothetical protein